MRVLLVKPHPPLPLSRFLMDFFLRLEPLELEIVAGGIPIEDEVAILDLSLEKQPFAAFEEQLLTMRPDIVGFTGFSSQAALVRELADLVKHHLPAAVTVVGGIHATVVPADYAGPALDIIVRGEGGTAFREIARRFKAGLPLHGGAAILSPRDPAFAELAQADPPPYPRIEEIPLPRRDLVDRSRYFVVWTAGDEKRVPTIFPRVATIRTSYGCPFNCSFCVVHHVMRGQYLQRPAEEVVDEIARLPEDHVYFVDDENFISKERMTRIAELLIERGIRKKYISWARSDTIVRHPELFALWKRAGLSMVYVGLEAMVGESLEKFNKRTTVEINRKAVATLSELGITLHASFMLDPDFDEDDFAALRQEVRNLGPAEITFTVYSPSPGTELWRKHQDDFILDPYAYYDCMHTILPTRLPIRKFYQRYSDLCGLAFRSTPLRHHKVKFPLRELVTVISRGFKYVFALRNLYKAYGAR